MRRFCIIINNAPIHTSKQVEEMIKRRNSHKFVYRTLYSPELNPIIQFWSLMKGKTKHHKLQDSETIEARIVDAAYEIPIQHLKNIIQHSKNHFVIRSILMTMHDNFFIENPTIYGIVISKSSL